MRTIFFMGGFHCVLGLNIMTSTPSSLRALMHFVPMSRRSHLELILLCEELSRRIIVTAAPFCFGADCPFCPYLSKVVEDVSSLHVNQKEIHTLSGSAGQVLSSSTFLVLHRKEGHMRVVVEAILEVDAE